MAGLASSIIGGGVALGGAIYGAIKSGQLNEKARRLVANLRDKNEQWFNIKRSQDYTQRADVQAAIKRQRELLDEQSRRAEATNLIAGGTDESLALQKEAANRSLAQATTDIAAAGASYNDNIENQYRAQDAALAQQQSQSYQQQAAQTSQAASQLVNAGVGVMGQGLKKMNA